MTTRRRAVLFTTVALLVAAVLIYSRSAPPPAPAPQPSPAAAQTPLRPSDAAQKSVDKAIDNFAKTRPPPPPPPSLNDK